MNHLGFRFFFFLGLILIAPKSSACIWTKASSLYTSPFYTSNQIDVCFTRPNAAAKSGIDNPTDEQYIREYERAMEITKRTVEKQINQRTDFNLSHFGFCTGSESNKIVIDLNSPEAFGANSNIGPVPLQEGDITISMGIVKDVIRDKSNPSAGDVTLPAQLREFADKNYLSSTGLHELLHALGFQHEDSWDSSSFDFDVSEVVQIGNTMDMDSIMLRGSTRLDEDGLAILSETDVQCLNMVASQDILNQPSRSIVHSTSPKGNALPVGEATTKRSLSQ